MSHPWRTHPKLQRRFHPNFPDDLQVIIHDGGPRLTDRRPELAWVRVTAASDTTPDLFTGRLLNTPHHLRTVNQHDPIQFLVPASGPHPLLVRPNYLRERPAWTVVPCNKCGLSELLDAPSDLVAKVFPNLPPDHRLDSFTSFCGLCGGIQVVSQTNPPSAPPPSLPKSWWQFWK